MKAFKPNLLVPKIEARLSRSWISALPLRYNAMDCLLDMSGVATFPVSVEFTYNWGSEDIHLFFLEQNLCEFLDPELRGLSLKTLQEDVRLLILQSIQEAVRYLFDTCKETLVSKSIEFFEEPKEFALSFILRNSEKTLCQIGVSEDPNTERFFNKIAQKTKPTKLMKKEDIVFPFRIEEGRLSLNFDAYKSLRCGDILLNQHPYVRFHYNNVNFFAEKNGNIVTVKGEIMEEKDDLPAGIIPDEVESEQMHEVENEVEENVSEDAEPSTDKGISIEQLPVIITFDTGKQNLTLEQVQQLHEGYTFELDKKVDELVNILANGQCIGQGEWVQVEDHLGVRITHLR